MYFKRARTTLITAPFFAMLLLAGSFARAEPAPEIWSEIQTRALERAETLTSDTAISLAFVNWVNQHTQEINPALPKSERTALSRLPVEALGRILDQLPVRPVSPGQVTLAWLESAAGAHEEVQSLIRSQFQSGAPLLDAVSTYERRHGPVDQTYESEQNALAAAFDLALADWMIRSSQTDILAFYRNLAKIARDGRGWTPAMSARLQALSPPVKEPKPETDPPTFHDRMAAYLSNRALDALFEIGGNSSIRNITWELSTPFVGLDGIKVSVHARQILFASQKLNSDPMELPAFLLEFSDRLGTLMNQYARERTSLMSLQLSTEERQKNRPRADDLKSKINYMKELKYAVLGLRMRLNKAPAGASAQNVPPAVRRSIIRNMVGLCKQLLGF